VKKSVVLLDSSFVRERGRGGEDQPEREEATMVLDFDGGTRRR